MTALVVSAIRNLREVQGSTPREILNYINSEYNGSNTMNDGTVQRKVSTNIRVKKSTQIERKKSNF